MKAILIATSLLFTFAVVHAGAPPVKASEAVAIAEKDLEDRSLYGDIHPESINLKTGGVLKGETYWEILWNKSFPAQTKGRNEIGVRVKMDGSYSRIVR